jgi:hypothetical protein
METDKERASTERESPNYERPGGIIRIPPDPPDNGESADGSEDRPNKPRKPWYRRQLRRLAHPITILTFVMVLINYWQYRVTSGQLREMRDDSQQTTRLLNQNRRQVLALMKSANATEASAGHAKSNAEAAQAMVINNRKSLGATLAQGKTALDASIAASRLDQRAWLTVTMIEMSSEPEAKNTITISYWITNHGKTPAIDKRSQQRTLVGNGHEPPWVDFPPQIEPAPRNIVPPGPFPGRTVSDPIDVSPQFVALYRSNKARLYFQGIIPYKDIFNIEHWTTVCAYHTYGTPLNEFRSCRTGNDIDRN